MDPVAEYLDTIRSAHVRLLAALCKKLQVEHGEVVGELLVETDDAMVFGSSMRIDAVVRGPKFYDLQVEPVPDLPIGLGIESGDARCGFGRFSWNSCRVQARVDRARGEAALRTWIANWMDLADEQPTDTNGLSYVIHAVRQVEYENGVLRFVVDFGSASIDAVHGLMTTFVDTGATVMAFGGEVNLS
jgi:hypothetical protein